jgi:hypothetical protein
MNVRSANEVEEGASCVRYNRLLQHGMRKTDAVSCACASWRVESLKPFVQTRLTYVFPNMTDGPLLTCVDLHAVGLHHVSER